MRTNDALDLLASSLALVFFTLCMTELAELSAVLLRNPILPAPHGPRLGFGNSVPAAEESDVCESRSDDAVQASFAEPMSAAPLLERAAPPLLRAGNCRR